MAAADSTYYLSHSHPLPDAVDRLRRASPRLRPPVPVADENAAATLADDEADPAEAVAAAAEAVAAAGCSCCDTHWLNGMPNTAPDSPRRCDGSSAITKRVYT